MTFIIHTRGFDLENNLQVFVETCLRMLLRQPRKISEVRVTMGEGEINCGKGKFCQLHLVSGENSYSVIQYGNSYEEAVLCSVKELDIKMHRN